MPRLMHAFAVALLLVAAPLLVDGIFIFRTERCNTNFNRASNWASNRMPSRPAASAATWVPPARVLMTHPTKGLTRAVDTFVAGGEYAFNEIVFGEFSTLTFDNAVEFDFKPAAAVGTWEARFVSGQFQTKECDLGCSKNYVIGSEADLARYGPALDASLPRAVVAPCSSDTIGFPANYSAKVYAESVYDWKQMIVDGVTVASTSERKKLSTSPVMATPSWLGADIRLSDTATCRAEGLYNRQTEQCVCFNSCEPSTADLANMAEAAREIAEANIAQQIELDTYAFALTYNLLNTPLLAHIDCLAADTDRLALAFRKYPTVHNASVTAVVDGNRLILTGEVSAQVRALEGALLTTTVNGASLPRNPPTRIELALFVYDQLAAVAGECVMAACTAPLSAMTCGPDAVPCEELIGPVYALSSPRAFLMENYEAALGNRRADLRLVACAPPTVNETCPDATDAFLSAVALLPNATQMAALFGAFTSAVSACHTQGLDFVPTVRTPVFNTGIFASLFGYNLAQAHVNRLVDAMNHELLAQHLATGLRGFGRIVDVSADQINADFALINPDDEDVARQRRNDTDHKFGRAVNLLYVRVEYSVYGPVIAPGSLEEANLEDWINDLINSYVLRTHSCFTLRNGYNHTCVVALLLEAKKDGCASKACLLQVAQSILGCGLAGADRTGKCFNDDPETSADVAAVTSAATASTGGGGGIGIGLVAGAAGGGAALIIIIIVVVLLTRRRQPDRPLGKKSAAMERTVVAFENPMYDDLNTNEPLGNDTVGVGDEGLYDEPALKNNAGGGPTAGEKRHNPLYDSKEDLLDNAPEETGYLDVNIEEEEDAPPVPSSPRPTSPPPPQAYKAPAPPPPQQPQDEEEMDEVAFSHPMVPSEPTYQEDETEQPVYEDTDVEEIQPAAAGDNRHYDEDLPEDE